jgi:hypothetical protein
MSLKTEVIGHWEKSSQSACSEQYPDRIEFRDQGLYFGQRGPQGTYTHWDAGTWEVVSDSQMKLSTANDAVITYAVQLNGNVLKFTDAQSCQIEYRKRP